MPAVPCTDAVGGGCRRNSHRGGATVGRLTGKVALVSGGARGQGEAEVRLFVEEGAKVVFGDVLDDAGEQVAKELGDNAVYVHLDVRREQDWSKAVTEAESRFGKLDVLM